MTSFRQRMSEDMQVRSLAPHTQRSYLQQAARHFGKSPELLGPDDIRAHWSVSTTARLFEFLQPASLAIAVPVPA